MTQLRTPREILDQAPPHSVEAERAVLACMLLSADCALRCSLRATDFYVPPHQRIARVIFELRDAGQPVDGVLVAAELNRRGLIDEVGGYAFLCGLANEGAVVAHFDSYCQRVAESARKRDVMRAAIEALKQSTNGVTAREAVEAFDAATDRVRAAPDAGGGLTLARVAMDYVEQLHRGKLALTSLGLGEAVDDAIGGGLSPGESVILAARPSHAKTAATLQACHYHTARGVPCLFINEEMPTAQIGKRTLQFVADLPIEYWSTNIESLAAAAARYSADRAPCHLVGPVGTVAAAVGAIRRHVRDGVRFVVVDYLQRLECGRFNERESIIYASKKITDVARELNINIINVAHLRADVEKRTTFVPTMRDLYGSDMLAKDASVILMQVWPWKLDQRQPKDRFQFFVAKVRNQELRHPVVEARFLAGRQTIIADGRAAAVAEHDSQFGQTPF